MNRMRRLASRVWLIQLALACVLFTQSLGLLHRALHLPAASGPHQAAVRAGEASGLATLFAGHEKDGDCRLFDQLAHADFAPPALSPLVLDTHGGNQLRAAFHTHSPRNERSPSARGPPTA